MKFEDAETLLRIAHKYNFILVNENCARSPEEVQNQLVNEFAISGKTESDEAIKIARFMEQYSRKEIKSINNWTYVKTELDFEYSTNLPDSATLSTEEIPESELQFRKQLAVWLMQSFIPFYSLNWFDKLLNKKVYSKAITVLNEGDKIITNLIKIDVNYSALKRVLSVMPDVPQKQYIESKFLLRN